MLTTAALIAAVALLGNKAAESAASEAAKDAYQWVKQRLSLPRDAPHAEIAAALPAKIDEQPGLAKEIGEYLSRSEDETVRETGRNILVQIAPQGTLVGHIENAKGVNVAGHIETVNQTFN